MAKKKTHDDSALFAFLGVLIPIIGFILVLLLKRNNKYAMYYAKQGLILVIACIIVSVITVIIEKIPFIGPIAALILAIMMIAAWIMGLIYSLSGEQKPIPIIGTFADKIKI